MESSLRKSQINMSWQIHFIRISEILQPLYLERRFEMYTKYAELRDKKGLRDADVAKATGISQTVFTDWKNGKSSPKVDKIIKIADFFEVSLDEFVR